MGFKGFAHLFHGLAEHLRRFEVPVVLGLKEEDGSLGMSHSAGHRCLQLWRERPAFRTTCGINRRTVAFALDAEHGLDAAEGISCDGDASRIDEGLSPQPGKRGELVIQMVSFEQPDHRVSGDRHSTVFLRLVDFVANIRSCLRTQTLTATVRSEEDQPCRMNLGPSVSNASWLSIPAALPWLYTTAGNGPAPSGLNRTPLSVNVPLGNVTISYRRCSASECSERDE